MDDDKLIELLTGIRISCAETNTKLISIQNMIDDHSRRLHKLETAKTESKTETTNTPIKNDLIMLGARMVGWLILIIASLTSSGPLIQSIGAAFAK